MEEILASIRRIISEDDAPAAEAEAAPEPAPEPPLATAPAPAPAPEPEPAADDVLELTDRVAPAAAETVGDIEAYAPPEPEPEPAPAPIVAAPAAVSFAAEAEEEEELVGAPSATAAASAFGKLGSIALPAPGRTLEDLARELLRPLLKQWLDENLPRIVEAKVAEEVERIARLRVR